MNKKAISSLLLTITILVTACGGSTAAPSQTATSAAGEANSAPQKGGEITVVYKDDLATLDPAIGYEAALGNHTWSVVQTFAALPQHWTSLGLFASGF